MLDTDDLIIRRKLNVDEYRRMGEAGILGEDDRVELINGELIALSPTGLDHTATVNGLAEALVTACVGRAIVSVQNPVRLDRFSEPQSDFAVLRLRADKYRRDGPPGSSDILPLVEVSDSSLRFDRRVKLPLYARAGIAELWIVDLQRRTLEAHRRPADGAYAEVATYGTGDTLALEAAPELSVRLSGVFE